MNTAAIAKPPTQRASPRQTALNLLMVAASLAVGCALYLVDPARHDLYPCMFYATTGLKCPGCGGLRATHELLHGHLAAAWELNPLAILLVPLYGVFAWHLALAVLRGHGLRWPTPRTTMLWLGLGALATFGILRNLPWF